MGAGYKFSSLAASFSGFKRGGQPSNKPEGDLFDVPEEEEGVADEPLTTASDPASDSEGTKTSYASAAYRSSQDEPPSGDDTFTKVGSGRREKPRFPVGKPIRAAVPSEPKDGLVLKKGWRETMVDKPSSKLSKSRVSKFRRGASSRGSHYQDPELDYINIEDIRPGCILHSKHVSECHDPNAVSTENCEILTGKDGRRVQIKDRYQIVRGKQAFHLNKSPIFTFHGEGLMDKPKNIRDDHVGIRPKHIPAGEYVKQNDYEPLEVEYMKGKLKLSPMSVVHFTEECSSSFDARYTIIGQLTAASMARLEELRKQKGC